jgi:preprotein translocase subunit SecD
MTVVPDALARESVDYVLSPAAIADVSIQESDPRLQGPAIFSVVVKVSDAEAKRLSVLTRDNVDRELRILWDGQVLFTPIIREAVPNGRLEIPRRTREEAETLARRLRGAGGSSPRE